MSRLDRNERTHSFSDAFIERVRARLDSEWLTTYPEPGAVYEKFSAFLNQPRKRLLFNSGSDQSIKAVYETYIDKGDKVLLHRPGYAMFPVYAKMFGADPVYQEFDSDLNFDYGLYVDRIDGSFRMAVLENPNGFIGVAPPDGFLRAFVEKCERMGVIAVVDEAYYFFHDITVADMLDTHENLIVIRTFSKALGLAGLRGGYTLSREENIRNLYKVKPMHEINGMALLVIDELVDNKEEIYTFIEETRESLQFLKDGLLRLGVESSQSVANFLAARFGRFFSGEELRRRLKEEDVLIRMPFREEILKEWTRIGTDSKEIMQKVINAAKQMVKESDVL